MSKIVEQYVLQHVIYSGTKCQTYRAMHMNGTSEYAVKVIKCSDFTASQALQDSMINEVQNLKKLVSEHIVRFHKMLKTNNNIYLVYELCAQGPLDRRLLERPLDDGQFILLAKHIASALRTIHQKNIVHCEVQPSSVLIKGDTFKLSNFASCRFSTDNSELRDPSRIHSTFASPEIRAREPPTRASDIYSFGMLLKHCSQKIKLSDSLREMLIQMVDLSPKRRPDILHVCNQLNGMSTPPRSVQYFTAQKDRTNSIVGVSKSPHSGGGGTLLDQIKRKQTQMTYSFKSQFALPVRLKKDDPFRPTDKETRQHSRSDYESRRDSSKGPRTSDQVVADVLLGRLRAIYLCQLSFDVYTEHSSGRWDKLAAALLQKASQVLKKVLLKAPRDRHQKIELLVKKEINEISSRLAERFSPAERQACDLRQLVRVYIGSQLSSDQRRVCKHLILMSFACHQTFAEQYLSDRAGTMKSQPIYEALQKMTLAELQEVVVRRAELI